MPRKVSPKTTAGEEGPPARRSRLRKQAGSAAAPTAETAAAESTVPQASAPSQERAMAAAAAAGTEGAPAPTQPAIDPGEIERRAYSYWLARGCQGGSAQDDWLRAEEELRRERGLPPKQA